MGLLFPLNERIEPIACLLFYLGIKMEVLAWNFFTKSHIEHGGAWGKDLWRKPRGGGKKKCKDLWRDEMIRFFHLHIFSDY